MNKKMITMAATAALAASAFTTTAYARLGFEPGETLGQALGAPLPEGLFFVDNEAYGRRDIGPDQGGGGGVASQGIQGVGIPNVGVNIPALVYATPFTFYDTRLELLYAAPFVHVDGGPLHGNTNRVDFFNQAAGIILAHDFGHDFGASFIGLVRPADQHFNDYTYADLRASFSYTGQGFDLTATVGYTGTFGGHQGGFSGYSPIVGTSDAIDVDFTATKRFGKAEFGFVGFYEQDINVRGDDSVQLLNGQVLGIKQKTLSLGGLIGYDFGRFTLQGYATRDVIADNELIVPGFGARSNYETRGFLRLIVPLYVAPAPSAATMVRARY